VEDGEGAAAEKVRVTVPFVPAAPLPVVPPAPPAPPAALKDAEPERYVGEA
jgi:hypothetical protein